LDDLHDRCIRVCSMSLWLKDTDLVRGSVSGDLQLVPYWIYRKVFSACPPLPEYFSLIGCDPPECIEFTNTNLDPDGRIYIRLTCEASPTGTAYTWDDDCEWADGITITEGEGCEAPVELKIESSTAGFNFYPTGTGFDSHSCPDLPMVAVGNAGRGGWATYFQGYPLYWNCGMEGGGIGVDCNGSVNYPKAGSIYLNRLYYYGSGTPIVLDADDLPIGNSVIAVWSSAWYEEDPFDWDNPIYHPPAFYANLTITVSKV